LRAELTDLKPYVDDYTIHKLRKTIDLRLLSMLNEARDATS
jgi:hypothetical protein